eukprot:g29820.t1
MSEVEETLNRIKTHKGVSGIVIVNSDGVPMRSTLDSKQTLQYSALISQLAAKARSVVRELDPQNDLTFLRTGVSPQTARYAAEYAPSSRGESVQTAARARAGSAPKSPRIRSKKHEIMVAPDREYILIEMLEEMEGAGDLESLAVPAEQYEVLLRRLHKDEELIRQLKHIVKAQHGKIEEFRGMLEATSVARSPLISSYEAADFKKDGHCHAEMMLRYTQAIMYRKKE